LPRWSTEDEPTPPVPLVRPVFAVPPVLVAPPTPELEAPLAAEPDDPSWFVLVAPPALVVAAPSVSGKPPLREPAAPPDVAELPPRLPDDSAAPPLLPPSGLAFREFDCEPHAPSASVLTRRNEGRSRRDGKKGCTALFTQRAKKKRVCGTAEWAITVVALGR